MAIFVNGALLNSEKKASCGENRGDEVVGHKNGAICGYFVKYISPRRTRSSKENRNLQGGESQISSVSITNSRDLRAMKSLAIRNK